MSLHCARQLKIFLVNINYEPMQYILFSPSICHPIAGANYVDCKDMIVSIAPIRIDQLQLVWSELNLLLIVDATHTKAFFGGKAV